MVLAMQCMAYAYAMQSKEHCFGIGLQAVHKLAWQA
jgi:hypothetical protein